jgi:hypothetical protein
MAGCGNHPDAPVFGEGTTAIERSKWCVLKLQRRRLKPGRPPVGKIALQSTGKTLCSGIIVRLDTYSTVWEVMQTAGVIRMKVCKHDRIHKIGFNTHRPKSRSNLFVRINIQLYGSSIVGVP